MCEIREQFMRLIKESEMEIGSSNIDILIEILSRLPAKSLLRFKCVSKGWQNIISDQFFQKVQFQRSKTVISGLFFQERYEKFCQAKYVPINNDQFNVQHTFLDFLPEKVWLIASSNGLLCCRNHGVDDRIVYVCNPAIKKYVKIEAPKGITTLQGLGFVFDPSRYSLDGSSSFTLVSIGRKQGVDFFNFHIYAAEIGEWRTSKETCSHEFFFLADCRGISASGVLYWMSGGNVIIAFDVEKEQSQCINFPVPFDAQHGKCGRMCIGESEGRLHFICVSDGYIRVWGLNCEIEWVPKFSMSLASIEDEHPAFLYNEAKIEASHTSFPAWIQALAFKDGILLLKLRYRFRYENLKEACMKFYLYNLGTRTMEEICTLDDLGLINGTTTSEELRCKLTIFSGLLKALPYNMSFVPVPSA